jgi:hypothetical protein
MEVSGWIVIYYLRNPISFSLFGLFLYLCSNELVLS